MAQRGVLAPLQTTGIDKFQVRDGDRIVTEITRDAYDTGAFDIIESEMAAEEKTDPQIFRAFLVIRAPVFVEGAKWQFFLGEQRISASISDIAFNERVFARMERFGVGDTLEVRLSLTQVLNSAGKFRNEYDIVEVIRTIRSPAQLDLLSR